MHILIVKYKRKLSLMIRLERGPWRIWNGCHIAVVHYLGYAYPQRYAYANMKGKIY